MSKLLDRKRLLKLTRHDGRYQWDATVCGYRDGMRQAVLLTAFADTRKDAVDIVCLEMKLRGYESPTVDHIARNR